MDFCPSVLSGGQMDRVSLWRTDGQRLSNLGKTEEKDVKASADLIIYSPEHHLQIQRNWRHLCASGKRTTTFIGGPWSSGLQMKIHHSSS